MRKADALNLRFRVRIATAALILWSAAMLVLAFRTGAQHDYVAYLRQWQLAASGGDPWSGDNTYGPLHLILAPLLPMGDLAPKMAIAGALLAANAMLAYRLLRERGGIPWTYWLMVPANFLVVGIGFIYGLNDSLVAALLVLAVLARRRGNMAAAGLLIGVAALTKYYPILLLPFFALEGRKLQWSLILGGVAVFAVGLAAAYVEWGAGFIDALTYSSTRGPKLLSVFAALGNFFPGTAAVDWAIDNNAALVVLTTLGMFAVCWLMKISWLESAVFGLLVVLTTYKVGHQQFYLPWLFLVAALPLLGKRSADLTAVAMIPLALFLSQYHAGYFFGGAYWPGTELYWVRQFGGAMGFAVAVGCLVLAITAQTWREPAPPAIRPAAPIPARQPQLSATRRQI
jgi:hypothetical protein